eukprot:4460240-Alexandrium_andersonii.AAC.1
MQAGPCSARWGPRAMAAGALGAGRLDSLSGGPRRRRQSRRRRPIPHRGRRRAGCRRAAGEDAPRRVLAHTGWISSAIPGLEPDVVLADKAVARVPAVPWEGAE